MPQFVSGWTDGGRVALVRREGDRVVVNRSRSRWEFFASGLNDTDREHLARDRRVSGVNVEGEYTRITCTDRGARYDVVRILKDAIDANPHSGVKLYETDVSPLRRLLSDNPNIEVDPDPRILFLDLEVDSRQSFEDMRNGKARLLTWAVEDLEGNQFSAVLQSDDDASERTIWHELFNVLDRYDCIVAWSGTWGGDTFDFSVMRNRTHTLGVRRNGGREILWNRWTWLDHLEVFKKYNFSSDDGGEAKTSYKLNHVAGFLLGEGKDNFDSSKTWEAWEAGGKERERLLKYNIKDTHLLRRIEEKTGFLSLHIAVCHICRIFPDTESLHATLQGDGFMLRLGSEYGYRFPSKPYYSKDKEFQKFAGAYVMPPKRTGAVDNVHVCDFAGLYPSIMRTWNMSPDTKIEDPSGASKVVKLPGRSTYFRNDVDGMFRIALDRLVAKRGEYTKAMKQHNPGTEKHAHYKRLSGAFKIVANSFYGITGSPFSRFFDPEIAEGVTQTGKWLLEQVIEHADAAGYDPFYGDTDSVFVAGVDEETFRAFVKNMNEKWSDLVAPLGVESHHIDLDFEKTFKRLIMVSAKRYAASYAMYKGRPAENDAKEVKGLEFKRGDSIRLAREFQREVVDLLLADGPLPKPIAARDVINKWRERMLYKPVELDDVKLSQALTKPLNEYAERPKADGTPGKQPAHVRVAKLMMDRGEPLGEGARVAYVMHRGEPAGVEAEPVPFDDADPAKLDRVYYWDKRLYPPTQRVLEHVYPQVVWKESTGAKKVRMLEQNGQTRLNFDAASQAPSEPTGRPKIRRRRRKGKAAIKAYIKADSPGDDDPVRSRLRLEALKAAMEANPGDTPIRLVIKIPNAEVEMTEIEGLKVATTEKALKALTRAIYPGNLIIPSDNPGQG